MKVKITEITEDKPKNTRIVEGDYKTIIVEVANSLGLNVTEVTIKKQAENQSGCF